jgi:twitching motility protein PilT
MDIEKFEYFLRTGIEENYTDITMVAGRAPIFGYCDKNWEWPDRALTGADLGLIVNYLMGKSGQRVEDFQDGCDVSYEVMEEESRNEVIGRFRITICKAMGEYCLSIRIIPVNPLSYEQLNLPEKFFELAKEERGLILITGATGQGKSTTISALINEINGARNSKIITIEDPVEFTYKKDKAFIVQREIGLDVSSYAVAVKQSLRQRPNVIMVGEIRDRETLDAVMVAAQTGHLVISSIHTTDARTTLSELMSYYKEDKEMGYSRLCNNLVAIVSQRLLATKENVMMKGRNIAGKKAKVSVIPACEILFNSESVKEAIKKGELDKLSSIMEKDGGYTGMQSFNQSICHLFKEGKITEEVAIGAAGKAVIDRLKTLEGPKLDKDYWNR